MPIIHPTALVDPGALIADDAEIGPYCIIGPHVSIGPAVRLLAHVYVTGHTAIGARTIVAPFASLGTPPQSVTYRGGPTLLTIGQDCDIREAVTMNTGTEDGGGKTIVGDRCLLMVNAHIAHDCEVGSGVIFANNVTLGGHVTVGDNTVIGGQSGVHQFVRIGEGVMVSGQSGVADDVIPFGYALGHRANLVSLNMIGLLRRGVTRRDAQPLHRAFRRLFFSEGLFKDRLAAVEQECAGDPMVDKVIAFIHTRKKRQLAHPPYRTHAARDDEP